MFCKGKSKVFDSDQTLTQQPL